MPKALRHASGLQEVSNLDMQQMRRQSSRDLTSNYAVGRHNLGNSYIRQVVHLVNLALKIIQKYVVSSTSLSFEIPITIFLLLKSPQPISPQILDYIRLHNLQSGLASNISNQKKYVNDYCTHYVQGIIARLQTPIFEV